MNPIHLAKLTPCLGLAVAFTLLSGCAVNQHTDDKNDPLEGFNRAMYGFNETVDKALIKPLAVGYETAIPQPARTGVGNFFNNLAYPIVIINSFLQGKFEQGAEDLQRFIYNSTFGLAGLIDIATPMGLEANNEDFGQTFGYWGFGRGYYLVLPFFGPSTVRDGIGLYVDAQFDLLQHHSDVAERNQLWAIKIIDRRARFLGAERVLEAAALDPYVFTREAYLQRRDSLIRDGVAAPREEDDDDDEEAFDPGAKHLIAP
ncbi:MAG: VacJ family lipoprotein [Gammaproteobacteria bacterium]|nr:VacJ family lipoprotein [Gammaproteobacteria bacterium]